MISDKSTTTGQVWTSVVTTFATEDGEEDLARGRPRTHHGAGWRSRDHRQSGPRTVATSGNDLLRLEPKTTITIGETKPATIIELLDGPLHVKAGKREDGDTLSIETQYLVATARAPSSW